LRVVVLEKEGESGTHQTGHNSGVVHSGVYYAPGSLKARLCTAGRERLREFALEKSLPYVECGKLIIAVRDDELPRLHELHRRAVANGVPDVRLLTSSEIRDIEPAAQGVAALHSPKTAITDFRAIAAAYASDVTAFGGTLHYRFAVSRIDQDADSVRLFSSDGREVRARNALVCAGLYGDRVARLAGDSSDPRIVPFRGDYFKLTPEKARLVNGLVYPVPDPDLPFLGVHLTRTVHGEVLVGPNAVLAGAREGYRARVVSGRDLFETTVWPGFWRFARRYWRTGAREMWRAASRSVFASDAALYVPGIEKSDLIRAVGGVRAQALDRAGNAVEDFAITHVGRVVNVRNAPSPAATSSLPIGDELAARLLQGAETAK
jgi:L-2-hydroxyglutarate oxidase LhgO